MFSFFVSYRNSVVCSPHRASTFAFAFAKNCFWADAAVAAAATPVAEALNGVFCACYLANSVPPCADMGLCLYSDPRCQAGRRTAPIGENAV